MIIAKAPKKPDPRNERPFESAVDSRRFLLLSIAGVLLMLIVVGSFNYSVDPYSVFNDRGFGIYQGNERYQNPGLARNTRYDTIITGTSHTENTLASFMDTALNAKSLRLSIAGSTAYEQYRIVQVALDSGQLKTVVWGLDYFVFLGDPEQMRENSELPEFLYDLGITTPFKYLLSGSTLKLSIKNMMGRGERGIDSRNLWFDEFEFSRGRTIEAFLAECVHPRTLSNLQKMREPGFEQSFNDYLVSLVKQYPKVTFSLFLPPYSVAYHEFLQRTAPGLAEKLLEFRVLLQALNQSAANVRLFDFQRIPQTGNLDNYKDLTHYDKHINELVIQDMADSRHLVPKDGDINAGFVAWRDSLNVDLPSLESVCETLED